MTIFADNHIVKLVIANRKRIFIWTLSLTILVMVFFVAWLSQLYLEVKTGIEQKNLFKPTQFFADDAVINTGESWDLNELRQEFTKHGYRERFDSQAFIEKDFKLLNIEELGILFPQLEQQFEQALLVKDAKDQFILIGLEGGRTKAVLAGQKELLRISAFQFPPRIIAQFLGGEAILQDYQELGNIPPACLRAVIAIEDSQFLEHSGVSLSGIVRAALANLSSTRTKQGGSTITQQTVKNYFLNAERTLKRKITELFMALFLEIMASKDDILETYLNIIYMGQNGPLQVRGFGAAANYYFTKPLQHLNLGECSLLAAVLNSPGLYDPFRKPENAIKRRDRVLKRMYDLEMITDSEAKEAGQYPLPKRQPALPVETAPYFILAAQTELEEEGINYLGKSVFLSLNLQHQTRAQKAVNDHLLFLERQNKKIKAMAALNKKLEAGVIIVDSKSGFATAIIGGRNYKATQFNRALNSKRQIGSIVKPFVYLASFLERDRTKTSPTSLVKDEPWTYKYDGQKWSPENYGKKYFGEVPLVFALANSLNVPAAKIGIEVGLENIIETMRAAGVSSEIPALPALTLGVAELSLKEVAQSYLTLARMGTYTKIKFVRSVEDSEGRKVYNSAATTESALDPISTAAVVSMMTQASVIGTAQALSNYEFYHPNASKTGTTSDYRDSWFAGFTNRNLAVVWVGFDDNEQTGLTGASGALPIWADFMGKILERTTYEDFSWPEKMKQEEMLIEIPEANIYQPIQIKSFN